MMTKVFVLGLVMVGMAAAAAAQGTLVGHVQDEETGAAIGSSAITVGGVARSTQSDANGDFVVLSVPQGIVDVTVSCVGYMRYSATVAIVRGDTVRLLVRMRQRVITSSPVVVTALHGRERETPATFANLERSAIREHQGTQDIPVILADLPSSTFYSESGNNTGYTYLNIRGFDSRRIAVLINGIPQNDPEDHNVYWLDFPDIAASLGSIQVQRGAGSAFYGPPAIGGSVNLVSQAFGAERGLTVDAGGGSYNTRRYAASFTSGLVDNRYAFHARISSIRSDGYRDLSWTEFSSFFFGAIRYDENATTQVNVYGGPVADHLAYYGIPKPDITDPVRRRNNPIARPEEIENFSQPHYELFHEWRISPAVTLNNTLFYVTGSGFFDYDGSWAPYSYYRVTADRGFALTGDPDTLFVPGALIRAFVSNRQFGWLPRVSVRHDDGLLTVGGEVRVHRSLHWGRLQWASGWPAGLPTDDRYYQYDGAKDMGSVFVNEEARLAPGLTLNASLQYAFNRYRLYNEKFLGNDFSVPYHFVNPRAGVNFNLTPEWNTYLSAGLTSREPRLVNLYDAAEASTPASWGGVRPQFEPNPAGGYDFSRPLVRPERLLDLEWGWGYGNAQMRATANIYLMEFWNEIVKSGQVDRFGQPVTGNAERTRHMGLELSLRAALLAGVEVNGNATLSRNRIVRASDFSSGSAVRLDGNPVAGFPDILANMRIRYQSGPCTALWSVRSVGRQYTDNRRDERRTVDPFVVHDCSVSWKLTGAFTDESLTASVYLNNVFNRLYAAYGEGDEFFVGAERNFFVALSLSL
jgi:iron complex outermembrane recepter protein